MLKDQSVSEKSKVISRLHGLSKSLGLSEETLSKLKTSLENIIGPKDSHLEPNSSYITSEVKDTEIMLRNMIAANLSWQDMEPLCWQLWSNVRGPDLACRIVELAFAHGNSSDVQGVVVELAKYSVSYYPNLDKEVRFHLIQKLWRASKKQVLLPLVVSSQKLINILPIEKLLIFSSYIDSSDKINTTKYYKTHFEDIEFALRESMRALEIDLSELNYTVGRFAFDLGEEGLSRKLLERVPREHLRYQETLDLLIQFEFDKDKRGLCTFGRQLDLESSYVNRLRLFKTFFDRVRKLGKVQHQDRAALNELLKKPFVWVPTKADAWFQLSELLIENSDLLHLLPDMLTSYHNNLHHYSEAQLDIALWKPMLKMSKQNYIWNGVWKTVAGVHLFVASEAKEEFLWDAFENYEYISNTYEELMPVFWEDIKQAALTAVSRSSSLQEIIRERMISQLQMTGDVRLLTEASIRKYIKNLHKPSIHVLDKIQKAIEKRDDPSLEINIIEAKSIVGSYSNNDLNRLWTLSNYLKTYDRSWRIATVVRSRGVLTESIDQIWRLSGERRREYPIKTISSQSIATIMHDFSVNEKSFIRSLIQIGPELGELFYYLDDNVKSIKKSYSSKRVENVWNILDQSTWINAKKRRYSRTDGSFIKPAMMNHLGDSDWSLVMMTYAEKLGLNLFGWQMSRFHKLTDGLISSMSRGQEKALTGKVGKWLRSLSPIQRKSWYEFAKHAAHLGDDKAYEILLVFLIRLSSTSFQNHLLAFETMDKMRVPLRVRRSFENWMVSSQYSELRMTLRSQSHMAIPESYRDSSIVR